MVFSWYNVHVIKGSGNPLNRRKESPMTKIEMLTSIREAVATNPEMVEFLNHEIELLQRKAATPRKPTVTQIENAGLRKEIADFLFKTEAPQTIKEIVANVEGLEGLSNQRVTHLLTALRKAGEIKRTIVKKVPYYEYGVEEGYAATEEEEG